MGWPLRMFQEEGYYFVTSRCYQGRLLLRPSVEMNEVVGGVLARAVQQSAGSVRMHAFTFASNHFHLLVWARGAALASFMQYLRANLSRKVGRLVDWSGGFWERLVSLTQQNGLRLLEVGATRPICPSCATAIEGAGAVPVTPLKVL